MGHRAQTYYVGGNPMTSQTDNLAQVLTWLHRGVLLALALCGLAASMLPDSGSEAAPPPVYLMIAMGLGVASVFCRQLSTANRIHPAARLGMAAAAYLLGAAIGITALVMMSQEAERQNALLFIAGAAILSLRGPATRPQPPASSA
jgi:hypothetical protein